MSRKNAAWVVAALLLAILLVACQPETIVETVEVTRVVTETAVVEGEPVEVTVVVTEVVPATVEASAPETSAMEPVTYYTYQTTDIPTLDPQVAEDVVGVDMIETLFVQLTNYDQVTSEVVPEAATSWQVSEDGLTYTFTLREDIPWVYHNPGTGETTQVVDEEGNPRFVTAEDFAYGIRRACDPNIGSYYSSVVAPLIVGCETVLTAEDPSSISPELVEAIGVSAPDPATLVVNLNFPAGYFLSMSPLWTLSAVPSWAVEEYGPDWIEAGNIVTNGRYVLNEWVHNVRWTRARNPLIPADLAGDGNIERVVTNVVPDISTGYALWLGNQVDYSGAIPEEELAAHLENFPEESVQVPDLVVPYLSFRMSKPPFDDVRVRRAFGAAFDRATYVNEVRQGQGLPMKHFAPPGIFGAPPIDEVGVGYDPEFARAQLAEAGFPDCEGFPTVSIMATTGTTSLNFLEFAQANWAENLGCSADILQIEQLPFAELLAATAGATPDQEAPHMWLLAWGPDYADENNWVGDVLWCGNSESRQKRVCTEVDDLIVQAREEPDPATRVDLYRQIEEGLFGPEGEMPISPLYVRINYTAPHTWLDRVTALFGGQQIYNWTIDQEAQRAARDE